MVELKLPEGASGVLPNQYLESAIASGAIHAGGYTIPRENVQPASLDLRLGEVAYRIRCSFLPGRSTVERRIKDVTIDELDLRREGAVLETNLPYLIPLKEQLMLPQGVRAKANPKSSTGRADVFTRVITDESSRFDEVAAGYRGGLYLEVVPLSFPVRVREDLSLNQLRLSVGSTALDDQDVRDHHRDQPLLFADGFAVPDEQLALSNGLFLSLNLRGADDGRVGYRSRGSAPLLDLSRIGAAEPDAFWESVRREDGDRIVLDPKSFYLLMSREAVSIPPGLAAEMTAYDPTSGELRTHYAGFFDPGFGFDVASQFRGSTAALEVRAHDVPFMIENGQRVCKLTFERMLAEPTLLYGQGIGSNYQRQTETLSKHFRHPGGAAASSAPAAERGPTAVQLDLYDRTG
ncbi:2'-deoxycytidine 5'-triphosphate deaminase [uncultured Jatrophihabitans sp.]|uniref:2'-deoxycytidine 5'-triphosphate deaminase n=1 Tax=uncultured Jatrophihabitans sp. TaxID=1610747 RepID=UPI0035CBC085